MNGMDPFIEPIEVIRMVEYIVRAQSCVGAFNSTFTNLHDAEISVKCIREVNSYLKDNEKYHGWVSKWEGYSLDDGSKVTVSCDAVKNLDF